MRSSIKVVILTNHVYLSEKILTPLSSPSSVKRSISFLHMITNSYEFRQPLPSTSNIYERGKKWVSEVILRIKQDSKLYKSDDLGAQVSSDCT